MPAVTAPPPPQLPIPIFQPSPSVPRYLLYDISHITYLRSHHAILGVLIGSLPQIPQQSVFLGLPLELQPEEAQLLVDKGIGYIVNDRAWHDGDFRQKCGEEREAIIQRLRNEGLEIAKGLRAMKKDRTAHILQQKASKAKKATGRKDIEKAQLEGQEAGEELPATPPTPNDEENANSNEPSTPTLHEEAHVFSPPTTRSRSNSTDPTPHPITPTASTSLSAPPPPPSNPPSALLTPQIATTYPLFAHLHSQGYYLSPGLRFGCNFSAYPGDPLRFHSHFLVNALGWDEEFDLIDLVAGGRLGTGVKKGWLLGGKVEGGEEGGVEEEGEVRCFCVEWGGM